MDLVPFNLEHEVSILMCFFLLFQSCIVYVVGSRIFFHFLYVLMKNVMLFPCNTSKTFSPFVFKRRRSPAKHMLRKKHMSSFGISPFCFILFDFLCNPRVILFFFFFNVH